MAQPRILAFAGSTRTESLNKKLVAVASEMARQQHGADVTLIDLREFPLPLYDGDLEQSDGIPGNAHTLYDLLKSHDGLLIASPEYNSSISGVLKNVIDWASRPRDGEPPLAAFSGKVAGLLAASPGQLGGLRGLVHVRAILGNMGVLVIPEQAAIGAAHEALTPDGRFSDDKQRARVDAVVASLVSTTARLKGGPS